MLNVFCSVEESRVIVIVIGKLILVISMSGIDIRVELKLIVVWIELLNIRV